MYEELYNAAKKYDTDLVISGVCFVGGNMFSKEGEYIEKSYFEQDTIFQKGDMKKLLLGIVGALPYEADDSRYGVAVWKNLFRHSMIKENNLVFQSEREILSEDTLFMVDVAKVADTAVGIPGAFYCYCRNDDSFSKSYTLPICDTPGRIAPDFNHIDIFPAAIALRIPYDPVDYSTAAADLVQLIFFNFFFHIVLFSCLGGLPRIPCGHDLMRYL